MAARIVTNDLPVRKDGDPDRRSLELDRGIPVLELPPHDETRLDLEIPELDHGGARRIGLPPVRQIDGGSLIHRHVRAAVELLHLVEGLVVQQGPFGQLKGEPVRLLLFGPRRRPADGLERDRDRDERDER